MRGQVVARQRTADPRQVRGKRAPEIAAAYPEWAFAGLYQTVVGTIDPAASINAQRRALAAFSKKYVMEKRGAAKPKPVGGFEAMPVGACAA